MHSKIIKILRHDFILIYRPAKGQSSLQPLCPHTASACEHNQSNNKLFRRSLGQTVLSHFDNLINLRELMQFSPSIRVFDWTSACLTVQLGNCDRQLDRAFQDLRTRDDRNRSGFAKGTKYKTWFLKT